ncbi:YdcF family protein [Acinetobacter sp. c2-A9]
MLLCIAVTGLVLFIYSPFYSRSLLWLLQRAVPVQINPIAAQSQKAAQLSLDDQFEPGSNEWIARRAYLYEISHSMDDHLRKDNLYARYKQLLKEIEKDKKNQSHVQRVNSETANASQEANANLNQQYVIDTEKNTSQDNSQLQQRFQQYRAFLLYVKDEDKQPASSVQSNALDNYLANLKVNQDVMQDSKTASATLDNKPLQNTTEQRLISKQNQFASEPAIDIQAIGTPNSVKTDEQDFKPNAIVVLGGGLTKKDSDIIINKYTENRLQRVLEIYQKQALPIVLSGVEAPYMQKWLVANGVKAELLENKSMNTCENTRFTALLLQKRGGAPSVYLITDAYHMPRSQRLFAQNGIHTVPIDAQLPNNLTTWMPSSQNWMHSRRATYEAAALMRDVLLGHTDCREVP